MSHKSELYAAVLVYQHSELHEPTARVMEWESIYEIDQMK